MLNTYYIGVKAIIKAQDTGRILILEKNADNSGEVFYDLPGGRIEDAETIPQTLSRELQEEIGLDMSPDKLSAHPIGMAQITSNLLNTDVGLCLAYVPLSVEHEFEPTLSSEHRIGTWYSQPELEALTVEHPHALMESIPYITQAYSLPNA